MPKYAKILHVDCQESYKIHLWALIDTDDPEIERFFMIRGTGETIEDYKQERKFLGTVVDNSAGLVWHIWYD